MRKRIERLVKADLQLYDENRIKLEEKVEEAGFGEPLERYKRDSQETASAREMKLMNHIEDLKKTIMNLEVRIGEYNEKFVQYGEFYVSLSEKINGMQEEYEALLKENATLRSLTKIT